MGDAARMGFVGSGGRYRESLMGSSALWAGMCVMLAMRSSMLRTMGSKWRARGGRNAAPYSEVSVSSSMGADVEHFSQARRSRWVVSSSLKGTQIDQFGGLIVILGKLNLISQV
jgi:hypothetical protein